MRSCASASTVFLPPRLTTRPFAFNRKFIPRAPSPPPSRPLGACVREKAQSYVSQFLKNRKRKKMHTECATLGEYANGKRLQKKRAMSLIENVCQGEGAMPRVSVDINDIKKYTYRHRLCICSERLVPVCVSMWLCGLITRAYAGTYPQKLNLSYDAITTGPTRVSTRAAPKRKLTQQHRIAQLENLRVGNTRVGHVRMNSWKMK